MNMRVSLILVCASLFFVQAAALGKPIRAFASTPHRSNGRTVSTTAVASVLASGVGGEMGSRVISWLTGLLTQYGGLLDQHPYLTRIISSGIVGGSGDILIQLFRKSKDKTAIFDFRRLWVFSSVAAFYIAPVIYLWFGYLNKLPYPSGMSNLTKAGIMTLLDQTFGAVLISAGFFYFFEMVQHFVPPYPKDRNSNFIKAGYNSNVRNLWDTLVVNWYCWPLINFVNFLVVPIQFRVLFSNFAAVFWNMYLSSKANS